MKTKKIMIKFSYANDSVLIGGAFNVVPLFHKVKKIESQKN